MPSGKQVLLALLERYSQRPCSDEEAEDVSERIRAGLLLHGSTPGDAWPRVDRMAWITATGSRQGVQGLGLKSENVLLLDLLETLLDAPMPQRVRDAHPEVSDEAYADATMVLWLLVSQLTYFPELSSVEDDGVLDEAASEHLIRSYRRKLEAYRRDPRKFLGLPDDEDSPGRG